MIGKKNFFFIEDDREEVDPKKGTITRIPDVIGQVSFAKRFRSTKYVKDVRKGHQPEENKKPEEGVNTTNTNDIPRSQKPTHPNESEVGKELEVDHNTLTRNQDRKLVIKVLPVAKAPRDRKRLETQILYVGKMVGVNVKTPIEERLYGDLYNHNGEVITEVGKVKLLSSEWEIAEGIGKVNSRHIVLSIGEKVDKQKATAATKLFLEDVLKSKGFNYVWAGHFDTQNDHFHVVAKKRNNLGENLRFSKNDLFVMMQKYSQYLGMVGIDRSIVARIDQDRVIKNVEEGTEHLKNSNNWYQSKLAKGNEKDFNAYNYKANLAGRLEEEIGVLEVKSFLEKELDYHNNNLLNRLRKNIRNDGSERVLKSLEAVRQMINKGLKIDSLEGLIVKAVEKKFDPRPEKKPNLTPLVHQQKVEVRDIPTSVVMDKFKEDALNFHTDPRTRSDILTGMDAAMVKAFNNIGKKVRFGKSSSCELVWYGEAGYISDYRTGEPLKWGKNKIKNQDDFQVVREVSLDQVKKELEVQAQKHADIQNQQYLDVAAKAMKLYYSYSQVGRSNYLIRKGFGDTNFTNVRFNGDLLVIPVSDINGKIWSLQYITDGGKNSKNFLKGGKNKGNFYILRNSTQKLLFEEEDKILLAEGFATAASINKATNRSVVVYFSASNLESVVSSLAEKYSDKKIIILADNDLWQEKNTGRSKAEEVITKKADHLNISMILPKFHLTNEDQKPTDFNDLHILSGIEEVKNQINSGFEKPEIIKSRENVAMATTETDITDQLRSLKRELVNLTDKRDIKQKVDIIIKTAAGFDKDLAASLDERLNSDEVRYSYIQPKSEVKFKNKLKSQIN